MNNTLEITGLCKQFPKFTLKQVSFCLPEGYIMGLIGSNGAGKTTVIKLLLNMLHKDSGSVQIFGMDHINQEEQIKEYIGIVFEQAYYMENWTLKELGKINQSFYQTWDSKKYDCYLTDFNLDSKMRVRSLSKGMKMKLMIATALSHETKLLLLDEPTSGLDAITREELLSILRDYVVSEDRSILFSSHITADLERIADYITLLHNGEILYSGTKDGLLEQYCIIKGDIRELKSEIKEEVIGLLQYPNGFEGLLPVSKLKNISPSIITDPATLDDIILFTDRKGGPEKVSEMQGNKRKVGN